MKRPRPSLVRRLTVAFIIGPAVAITLLIVAIRPLIVDMDDSNVGPEIAMTFLATNLARGENGALVVRPGAGLRHVAQHSPRMWFIVADGDRELAFGPVPAVAERLRPLLSRDVKNALFGNVGAAGRVGDASFEVVDTPAGRVRLLLGGVDPASIDSKAWILYAHHDFDFYLGLFVVIIICASGYPIAIPIVIASVRRTARAASGLDPANLAGRLPERGVVKELLPIVGAFNAALQRLADAFERRRRFIADVAHELRTPLAVLNMHVEALPGGAGKPDLQRTVFRLGQMIGQMLDAERLALAGRRHEPVDLVALARAAVADFAPLAVANGYEVAFSAARDAIAVDGDPHSITRALTNLLGNALAHGGGGGTIEVRVGGQGEIDVVDQGPGVPVEARERIFEPFRRERWDRDGCGLGLHLVREIMHAHGGHARLLGAGPGAVFRLEFPMPQPA